MKTSKSLKAAIKNGAFMVFCEDWLGIMGLSPEALGKALYLAVSDSWNDKVQQEIGNGFLCIPVNRIGEITKNEGGETVAAYTALIKSNISARRTYIRNNKLLAKALYKIQQSTRIDDCSDSDGEW